MLTVWTNNFEGTFWVEDETGRTVAKFDMEFLPGLTQVMAYYGVEFQTQQNR